VLRRVLRLFPGNSSDSSAGGWRVAACCSVLQRVAACCSVSQRVAACRSVSQRVLQCVAVCCRVCQRALEVYCSVCCRVAVLQCVCDSSSVRVTIFGRERGLILWRERPFPSNNSLSTSCTVYCSVCCTVCRKCVL